MTERPEAAAGTQAGAAADAQALPDVDFSSFVLSLAATALVQLGVAPDPSTGEAGRPDLLLARHTIDTLEMLRDKTRGNLDAEEQKLVDGLLYELRLRFVEVRG